MRILIINPNSDQATETILRETAEKFVQKRFEFDVVSMTTSPKLVVSYEDQYASAAELAQTIRSSLDKYDAFVLACHADPNYDLAKEVACGKPVFGIAESSMHMAAMRNGGFAQNSSCSALLRIRCHYAKRGNYSQKVRFGAQVPC